LGTKGGRSITGKAIKIGGIAALGTAAYKGYKHWRSNKVGVSIHELNGDEAQERAFLLIAAMVSAAHADGRLDDDESKLLKREILNMKLPENLLAQVTDIVNQPLTVTELSEQVKDDAVASEVYLAARIFIDEKSTNEELTYLADLVQALGLSKELVTLLDAELT